MLGVMGHLRAGHVNHWRIAVNLRETVVNGSQEKKSSTLLAITVVRSKFVDICAVPREHFQVLSRGEDDEGYTKGLL